MWIWPWLFGPATTVVSQYKAPTWRFCPRRGISVAASGVLHTVSIVTRIWYEKRYLGPYFNSYKGLFQERQLSEIIDIFVRQAIYLKPATITARQGSLTLVLD